MFYGDLTIAAFSIIPIILNLNYYRKTRIIDYFIVALFFISYWFFPIENLIYYGGGTYLIPYTGVHGQFELLDFIIVNLMDNFLWYFLWIVDALPLAIIALRAKYGSFRNMPLGFKLLISYPIGLLLINLIDQNRTILTSDPNAGSLLWFSLQTSRMLFHGIIVLCFLSTDYRKTSRTQKSRLIWIASSICWIIGTGIYFVTSFIFTDIIEYYTYETAFIGYVLFQMAFILLLINHIFFPEAVLFTHEHIVIAMKSYDRVKNASESSTNKGIQMIKDYLDTLPDDIKAEYIKGDSLLG